MSVNITVNGKFRACNKPSILDDPVRVKKQLEDDLRKQRLLEVREESKKLARKIRNDVAAEKDRQLRNLEAIKAQELECWRQHVLDQKSNEYRQALFQIGTAHNAAKLENEAMAERQAAKEQERKQFKKKTNERIGVKPKQNIKKVLQAAGTQTPNVLMKTKTKKTPKKRKRKICAKEHTSSCHCTSDESESDDDNNKYSDEDDSASDSSKSETTKSVTICPCPKVINCPCTSSSSSTSLLSSTCTDEEEPEKSSCIQNKNGVLSKNPPVIVDIDVGSNDSISITAGEIKDKYAQSNRQFHHVVRKSSPEKPLRSPQKSRTATTTAKPRFTQVSKILNAKSATSVSPSRSRSRSRSPPKPPPPSLAATTASTTAKSPHKSSTSGRIQITLSGKTVTMDKSTSDKGRDSSRSRVQSYDYNNKYTRDYAQPTDGIVHEPTLRERKGPCAVAQAEIERELELRREEERKRMCARSDERGRKALEREQARRDCIELTERLDALTQEYPQLLNPTDVRIQNHQLYVSREKRIEQKRNTAIEELLLRPAIITCPEVGKQRICLPQDVSSTTPDVGNFNLASPHDQFSNSSDSRCSILLGYVDDQKKKIRNDLQKCADGQPNQNKQKAERLKNLLLRIEDLRKALCEELEKNGSGDSMQQVINDVSDMRRERERMFNKEAPQENGRQSPLAKQLNDVEQKEALLEQKLRELCKMQEEQASQAKTEKVVGQQAGKILKKSDGKECRVQTTGNKPLEIIIKLKNEGSRRSKQNVKKPTKSPRKVSTLIDTPTRRLGVKRSASSLREKQPPPQQQQKATTTAKQGEINRQNSYDSNSTSYRSLPSRIANEVDALVDQLALGEEEAITDIPATAVVEEANAPTHQSKATQRPARLNPLIAHYVQRLLGMSRNSVLGLGVSSSDIETPSSSIMNVSSNRVGTVVNVSDSQERIQRVQRFINENRSFISELEDTLRSQSDVTLETSIRMFEEIWQQRLRQEQQSGVEKAQKQQTAAIRHKEIVPATVDARARIPREQADNARYVRDSAVVVSQQAKVTRNPDKGPTETRTRAVIAETMTNASQQQRAPVEQTRAPTATHAKQTPSQQHRQFVQNEKDGNAANRAATTMNAERETQPKRDIAVTTEERRAEEQIARYEQLTENCTQRIAELTELIQKVRIEKKRLMEVTLSSVSEGRNSTEYIELPDGTRRRSNASVDRNTSISSGSSAGASVRHALTTQPTTSIDYTPPNKLEQQAAATSAEGLSALDSAAPLEKHKPTGVSRDSGISISRPLTAQDMEPPSQASSTTHPSNHAAARKTRPPPTLQRYSPNFAEDDVVHELSTIIEVDTPATSRVNATTIGAAAAAAEASRSRHLQPQPFPTFEEYAREMNLDVTQLDADTSMRIQHEFETLIAQLCSAQGGAVPDYREFPSLSAYLRNLSVHQDGAEQSHSPETIEDLISCLRIANLSVKAFPTRQEYLRQIGANSQSGEFLDSASLENISDARTNSNTETESESINIEEELRRRQLLQHSFRTAKTKEQIFSSTVRDGAEHGRGNHSRVFAAESGIEKLSSTSENGSSEFERQLFSLGMKWPATMRARNKEAKAIDSSNTSTSPERMKPAAQRTSPRKDVNNVVLKSPQRSPDTTMRDASPKLVEKGKITAAKEVQFERSVNMRSPTLSPTHTSALQQLGNSPERSEVNTNKDATLQKQRNVSPKHDKSNKDTVMHDGSRNNKSSERSLPRSSDCEFVSDFGRPLNLRDFLTKELLKHASSSSTSSTPTDESLRSAFLQSIIETMTPRTNNGGSNLLDRQKTSTPVTHSASSNPQSSGEQSVSSACNTASQLFSGESCISSVRFFERSITRTYPRNAPNAETTASDKHEKPTDEPTNETNVSKK
ncbi:uncharacterized protein LOC105217845 [Zeugodacus cucurbitae]|uniref:Uncharacterized protein n=1 Tax=Zeugodacus cucurbitae TaxID=28588 RepID=A0A0A1X3T5_ZEUCU|nr:uncharacterized protein LOC105217845 [Zeugodacus cucurbitae]